MINSLDLRHDGILSIELAKELTRIEVLVRKEYTDYIGGLSKVNALSGLEWLINVTCRNPYQTKIFDNFCKLKLLDYCIDNRLSIDVVLVSNQGMKEAVCSLCENRKVSLDIVSKNEDSENFLFFVFRRILVSAYVVLISFLVPRLFVRGKKHLPDSSIIYTDLYAKASDFGGDGVFEDKCYTGMTKLMSEKDSSRVWYVPFIPSIRNPFDLKWIIDKSRKSDNNFLIMEEWLTLTDYLYSFYQSFILPLRIKNKPKYYDIDVSKMISHEVLKDLFSPLLSRTVSIYCFINRLKKNKVEIEKVIDWNENQVVDRAQNLAIREFYPLTKIVGYQGYIVSDHYVSHAPSCYEIEAGIIPDKTCVVSAQLIQSRKFFCSAQDVSIAPAFRFQKLLEYEKVYNTKREFILVALPYHLNVAKRIIDICFEWSKLCNINFVVKKHPAISEDSLISNVSQIKQECFKITTVPLYELFDRALLMISSDSSACFEAVSHNVHVVMIGNITGPTSNPLDGIVDSRCWSICYDHICMQMVLENNQDHCDVDLTKMLVPVNKDSVIQFLNCDL